MQYIDDGKDVYPRWKRKKKRKRESGRGNSTRRPVNAAWCGGPLGAGASESPMPFGRYKGNPLREVPEDYLRWCLSLADLYPITRALIVRHLSDTCTAPPIAHSDQAQTRDISPPW